MSGNRIRVAEDRTAENDDNGVEVVKHPEIAAQKNERANHGSAGQEPDAGCDVHLLPQQRNTRAPPPENTHGTLDRRH